MVFNLFIFLFEPPVFQRGKPSDFLSLWHQGLSGDQDNVWWLVFLFVLCKPNILINEAGVFVVVVWLVLFVFFVVFLFFCLFFVFLFVFLIYFQVLASK